MPRVSVLLFRLSLTALAFGALLGMYLLSGGWGLAPPTWLGRLRLAHVHLMLFGWLGPFVLATGYWILPRATRGDPRGSPRRALGGGVLLTAGTIVGTAGLLSGSAALAAAGRAAGLLGTLVFATLLWPRVRAGS